MNWVLFVRFKIVEDPWIKEIFAGSEAGCTESIREMCHLPEGEFPSNWQPAVFPSPLIPEMTKSIASDES